MSGWGQGVGGGWGVSGAFGTRARPKEEGGGGGLGGVGGGPREGGGRGAAAAMECVGAVEVAVQRRPPSRPHANTRRRR